MKPIQALYKQDNKYYFRNDKGQITAIPVNKFEHNEIVRVNKKHHNNSTFIKLLDPKYTEESGWLYGIGYIDRQGGGSGCSYSYKEDRFEKLDNSRDILYAKRYYAKERISQLKVELKQKECELEKLEYALSVSVPDWNKIERDCHKCGKLFHTHGKGGNYNRDLCIECDTNPTPV